MSRWRFRPHNKHLNRAISRGLIITRGLTFQGNPNSELGRHWAIGWAAELAEIDVVRLIVRIRMPAHRESFWDMDHIKPVVQGGGMCSLDNLQTLCCRCHAAKTFAKSKTSAEQLALDWEAAS